MFATVSSYLSRAAAGAVVGAFMFTALGTTHVQAATVDEFLANPTQVMAQYPNGGADLISLIRDVATSHPEALSTLTGLLSSGTADQQAAVGSGMGQAYKIVLNTDQAYASQIAAAVGNSSSDSAKTAYSGATGNVAIGSAGAGAGGGGSGGTAGGSGSGGTPSGGANSGSGGTTGQSSTQNSGSNFTGGGGGVGGASSSGSSSGNVSPR